MRGVKLFRTLICTFGCVIAAGCSQQRHDAPAASRSSEQSTPSSSSLNESVRLSLKDGPAGADFPSLHHLLQITDNVYCGGEPRGAPAFAGLVRLGVQTVVSVDGARPDVETARRHGLRYVHIPIGYDGIEKDEGLSLARLVRDAAGPFYIHCHHGRHRGPAAAAVVYIAAGDLDHRETLEVLERAGTDKRYRGLWRDVENYRVPTDREELPRLVEIARVGSLAAAMVRIDRAYDNLKLCRDVEWSVPAAHPDLVPVHKALLIKESFRETGRHRDNEFDEQFSKWLAEAETAAKNVEDALARNTTEVRVHFRELGESCRRCHDKYRK